MNDKQNHAVERLIKECNFKEATAKAYIRFNGKCAYCGLELIGGKANYAAGTIDHLLSQTKYEKFVEDEENYILCCLTCNSLKRTMDVLKADEDPGDMIKYKKEELISRVKTVLARMNTENDKIRLMVAGIVGEGIE